MRIGLPLALGLGSRNTAAAAVLNRATVALSSFYQGSYGGMPWAGTASAGTSGAKSLSALGVAPAVGSALGGFTPADLNGSTMAATDGTNTTDTYISDTAARILMLVRPTAAPAPSGLPYTDPGICTESGGSFGLNFTSSGVGMYQASTLRGTVACSTNNWHLIDFSFNGTTMSLSVDGGAPATFAAATLGVTASGFRVGVNFDNTVRFTGQIMEVATGLTALAGTTTAAWKAAVNARYGLSL